MSEELTFDSLKLLPGTKVDLRSEQYTLLKGYCTYLGFNPGRCFIVTTPMHNGAPVSCKAGAQVTLRFFVNHLNCACAFRTDIVHVAISPFPQLYLAIPDQMEVGEVRNSARANVNMVVSVIAEKKKKAMAALLGNLSAEGARLQTDSPLDYTEEFFRVSMRLQLLGQENLIQVKAKVRSHQKQNGKFIYGMEFVEVVPEHKVIIYAYVLEHLATT